MKAPARSNSCVPNPISFRSFKTSHHIIQLEVMPYEMARYPTSDPPLAPTNVVRVGNVGILENFLQNILWGLFEFAYIAHITYTTISFILRGRGFNI